MARQGKKIIPVIIVLLVLSGCVRRFEIKRKKITIKITESCHDKKAQPTAPQITIFVHGACVFPRKLTPSIHCSSGLHLVKNMDKKYYYHSIAQTLCKADPQRFSLETFYNYCWPGDLNAVGHKKEAQKLYKQLCKLIKKYKKEYNQKPFLRLIGYSHGCNMILNLARANSTNDDLIIDQLILLAVPVQAASAHLVKKSMFKKVYSFYSRGDFVQIIDPQRLYKQPREHNGPTPFFSRRRFKPSPKLKQVKVKLGRRAPGHPEFIKPRFLKLIPHILDAVEQWPELDKPAAKSEYLLKINVEQ